VLLQFAVIDTAPLPIVIDLSVLLIARVIGDCAFNYLILLLISVILKAEVSLPYILISDCFLIEHYLLHFYIVII
jgi:hypothetical protein